MFAEFISPGAFDFMMLMRRKGLIVKEPFASMIVDGEKVWEIRKSRTKVRGETIILRGGKPLYAWVLRNARRFERAKKVKMTKGAQVWANGVVEDE